MHTHLWNGVCTKLLRCDCEMSPQVTLMAWSLLVVTSGGSGDFQGNLVPMSRPSSLHDNLCHGTVPQHRPTESSDTLSQNELFLPVGCSLRHLLQ